MTLRILSSSCLLTVAFALGASACDDGEELGTEADRYGVGAACTEDDHCRSPGLRCLDEFKGGYCGLEGCTADADCPDGSACVAHENGETYCFRICLDKAECNLNRRSDDESNCSANITFVEAPKAVKACVPPAGG
ncbi:MAG: hypothetical protein DIU78_016110 [Pseudomonadota bacterium]|nr:MAG: hypothetical protein DIU78_13640 [Pseudomonadota bacterium]